MLNKRVGEIKDHYCYHRDHWENRLKKLERNRDKIEIKIGYIYIERENSKKSSRESLLPIKLILKLNLWVNEWEKLIN